MVRASAAGLLLGALLAAPLFALLAWGVGPVELVRSGVEGVALGIDAVGWVLVPQIVLAVGVISLALQKIAYRVGGLGSRPTPSWLDPAVESALLLGMLGTLSGMVSGFVGLSPDELEPGPLVHSLGRALRSSFVGFAIALVGVWTKERPATPRAEVELA